MQWDPERSPTLVALPYRSLQLGLSGEAVDRYVNEWTVSITDVTEVAHRIHHLLRSDRPEAAAELQPQERPYPLPDDVAARINASREINVSSQIQAP